MEFVVKKFPLIRLPELVKVSVTEFPLYNVTVIFSRTLTPNRFPAFSTVNPAIVLAGSTLLLLTVANAEKILKIEAAGTVAVA
ncbi:hypothetical protein BOQ64_06470 [Chryseobacterium sp. CH25]|nr:hypothetical protein BOQ64_06470 [Chryseobacterium sp. CH25]